MIKPPALPELKPRERLLAVGSGVILLLVLMDRLVLNPWIEHTERIREEIQAMEESLQYQGLLLSRKGQVMKQLAAYQRYLRPVPADELQMAALLGEVEDMAEESQVTLGEIKPLAVEVGPSILRYPLDIQFECTLEEWVDLVSKIEASPSLYQVERAGLSAQEGVPDRLKGSLRVVGTAMRSMQGDVAAVVGEDDAAAVQ